VTKDSIVMGRLVIGLGIMLFLSVGSTCERPLELEIKLPVPEIAVSGVFTPNKPFEIVLSSTRSALAFASNEYLTDAEVSLWQGERKLETLSLVAGPTPYYQSKNHTPFSNTQYRLEVSAPGFRNVTAFSTVPQYVRIIELESDFIGVTQGDRPGDIAYNYAVSITFDDPGTLQNYYHLLFHQEIVEYQLSENGDTVINGRRIQPLSFASTINNNAITAYLNQGVLIEDEAFQGRRVRFSFSVPVRVLNSRELPGYLYAELRHVSEPYYKFFSTVSRNENNVGPPYTEPVIVYSNVEAGRGVFAGFNTAMDSIRVIW
jgi:hypothetical protein